MEHLVVDIAVGQIWHYVLAVGIASAASWYTYTRVSPPQSNATIAVLRVLRTIGLACLLILLFEPILRVVRSETISPRLAVVVDESRSMPRMAKRDTVALRKDIQGIVDAIGSDLEIDLFGFSDGLRDVENPGLHQFVGYRTDITQAISTLGNRSVEGAIGAILLITDGQHNGPEHPMRTAEQTGLGVYSIGIGDTTMPRDLAVTRLLVSSIGVVGEAMPVTFDVEASRIGDGQYEVYLEDNGTRVLQDRVTIRSGIARQTITLTWKPAQEGVRKLSVVLRPADGEPTTANNRLQTFVDVRAFKRRIVLIAGSPSPDVTFIKASLSRDPSVRVTTFIQKQGSEFYEGIPTAADVTDIEAVVMVGYPTSTSSAAVTETIAKACANGTALLYVPSLQVDYQKLGSLEKILPFRVTGSRPQEFLVTPEVSQGRASDPIMRLSGNEQDASVWNALPPIYRTETFVEPMAGAQTLATLRVGNASLEEPLIMKRDDGRTRTIALLGYGLYRWRLMGTAPLQSRGGSSLDVLDLFMSNSVAWLRVRDSERRVVIAPTQTFYATGEVVGFAASVLDESFAAIDDADVVVTVRTPAGELRRVLGRQGGGRYFVELGALPPGDYTYSGTASRNGTMLGTRSGRFTVGELNIEETGIVRNVSLLSTLAQRTGAITVNPDQIDSLRAAILRDPRMRDIVRTRDREYPLYHLPWIVVAAILSFAAEWTLRKRRGLV